MQDLPNRLRGVAKKIDWRLEKSPQGDWRFLGHPTHDARGNLVKSSEFVPWVLHCICGKLHDMPKVP
jgi:hypothetical protein